MNESNAVWPKGDVEAETSQQKCSLHVQLNFLYTKKERNKNIFFPYINDCASDPVLICKPLSLRSGSGAARGDVVMAHTAFYSKHTGQKLLSPRAQAAPTSPRQDTFITTSVLSTNLHSSDLLCPSASQ